MFLPTWYGEGHPDTRLVVWQPSVIFRVFPDFPMSSFSLLLPSLNQPIPREVLEEASIPVASLTRADGARLQRDLFGIVVSGLPEEDARIFREELERLGFPTDLVADEELPRLAEPFAIQRVDLQAEKLVFTDVMGRIHTHALADLLFIAGGMLERKRSTTAADREPPGIGTTLRNERNYEVVQTHQTKWETVREFRADFFFPDSPARLRFTVAQGNIGFLHGRPLQLKDHALLFGAMMDFRALLPDERISMGLKQATLDPFYPSAQAFEKEIVWNFHRLSKVV